MLTLGDVQAEGLRADPREAVGGYVERQLELMAGFTSPACGEGPCSVAVVGRTVSVPT